MRGARKPAKAGPGSPVTEGVQALVKTFRILEAIADAGEMGVTRLSERLGYSKSTIHRILETLKRLRYVRQNQTNERYTLAIRIFELGIRSVEEVDLVNVARPVLETLAAQTNETVHLAVLDDWAVVYLDKIDSPHLLRMFSSVGRRAPAYCTGLGKALLAWQHEEAIDAWLAGTELVQHTANTITRSDRLKQVLGEIRDRGYATDVEEHEVGIRCTAAPVRDRSGQVVAAISVSCPWLSRRSK